MWTEIHRKVQEVRNKVVAPASRMTETFRVDRSLSHLQALSKTETLHSDTVKFFGKPKLKVCSSLTCLTLERC